MPTEVVKIVDPDNGSGTNYTSLSAWESGEQKDLVTADEIAVAKCRSTNGSADTTAVTIAGWTTDSTRYIKIWTDPSDTGGDGQGGSYRHKGVWPGSSDKIYRLTAKLTCQISYTKIYGIAIQANVGIFDGSIRCQSSYTTIGYVYSETTSHGAGYYQDSGTNNVVYNSIFISAGNYSHDSCTVFMCTGSGYSVNAYNCTAYSTGTTKGVYQKEYTPTGYFYNCIAQANAFYSGGGCFRYSLSGDYNLSQDSTAPGSNSVINTTLTFVNKSGKDLHLSSSDSAAIGAGTTDPGSGLYSDDIDGDSRGSSWDIGADEYVSAGGGSIIPIIMRTYRNRRNN